MPGADGRPQLRCGRHTFTHRPTLLRALRISATVGTTLLLINQLDVILHGHLTLRLLFKLILTYIVPFGVAMYSALQANRVVASPAMEGAPEERAQGS